MKQAYARPTRIAVVGLHAARGLEIWRPVWPRLRGASGTPVFTLTIVR